MKYHDQLDLVASGEMYAPNKTSMGRSMSRKAYYEIFSKENLGPKVPRWQGVGLGLAVRHRFEARKGTPETNSLGGTDMLPEGVSSDYRWAEAYEIGSQVYLYFMNGDESKSEWRTLNASADAVHDAIVQR